MNLSVYCRTTIFVLLLTLMTGLLCGCQKPTDIGPSLEAPSTGMTNREPLIPDADEIFSESDRKPQTPSDDFVSVEAVSSSQYVISSAGTYVLSGEAENFSLIVDADRKDQVTVLLQNAHISNTDFPIFYVRSAGKCFLTLSGDNDLSVSDSFTSDNDVKTDAVIFSKDDLTINGSGSLTILSMYGGGICCKDDLKITGGSFTITSGKDAIKANDSIAVASGSFFLTAGKDGLHCENKDDLGSIYIQDGTFIIQAGDDGMQATSTLVIDGGSMTITAQEGLEATFVQINGGTIHITAGDDGINASEKSTECEVVIEINGGNVTIVMGPGDTDALDANGTIIVNGGTIDITGSSTFDADRGSIYNGGTIIINGVQTDSIPSEMSGPGAPGGANPMDPKGR